MKVRENKRKREQRVKTKEKKIAGGKEEILWTDIVSWTLIDICLIIVVCVS